MHSPKQHNKQWYAIYTKYKCEKKVVDQLSLKGIEAYTPLLSQTKKYLRKVKTYFYPLLNNYAFVRIDSKEKVAVLNTQHVISFVNIGSEIPHVRDHEIKILKRIVGEVENIECMPIDHAIGQEVEIIQGSLTGLKGELIHIKNKKEFIVRIESLHCQLKLGIHPNHLQAIKKSVA